MSGGRRRGEVRVRKGGPVPKQAGGTHNRKARRAAGKMQQAGLFEPTAADPEEFARKREARRRAEREAYWAGKTDADIEAMALAESGSHPWDPLFLGLLMVAVPGWVERHFKTDPKAREGRAHALGELIAYDQGSAAIVDPEARGTEEEGAAAKVFNAIAEGLAIGAYCPGGATFIGINWRVEKGELRVTNGSSCQRYTLGEAA